jgi:prepilin-type N-terminal cleavage/methylation domain-containing protein
MFRQQAGRRGFTLVELLVCVAIIAVLAGILFTTLAPVRERARETRCLSNLRQISKAIQIYRQDYQGQDPPAALTYDQLGLPWTPGLLILGGYLPGWEIFQCPSEYWGPEDPMVDRKYRPMSYQWSFSREDIHTPPVPRFSERVARRGEDTPLAGDPHHGEWMRGRRDSPQFWVLIVRLGGQVQRTRVGRHAPGWEW